MSTLNNFRDYNVSTRDIYVDSSRRLDPYGNVYTMFIQDPIKLVTQVDLVAAVLPNTMYNVTNPNVFTVNGTSVKIDPGFYSACSLTNSLNNNQTLVNFDVLEGQGKIIASNVSTTGSFTFTNVSSEFSNVTKIPNNASSFQPGSELTQFMNNQVIISNNVFDFHTTGNFVFLDIDELRPPYPIDAVNYSSPYKPGVVKDDTTSNAFVFSQSFRKFATIPMDTDSGTLKHFKENSDYKISVKYPVPIDKIDRLTIRWLDTNGNILNFNGAEQNSFILRFHIMQPPEITVEEKVKQVFENKTLIFYFSITIVMILFILFS